MSAKVAYRGVPFENGIDADGNDKYLIIPPLPLNIVRKSVGEVSAITDPDPIKQVHLQNERVIEVILEAIKRNYPDFTREELDNFITLQTIQSAYQAAIGSNTTPDGKLLPASVRSEGEIMPNENHI